MRVHHANRKLFQKIVLRLQPTIRESTLKSFKNEFNPHDNMLNTTDSCLISSIRICNFLIFQLFLPHTAHTPIKYYRKFWWANTNRWLWYWFLHPLNIHSIRSIQRYIQKRFGVKNFFNQSYTQAYFLNIYVLINVWKEPFTNQDKKSHLRNNK